MFDNLRKFIAWTLPANIGEGMVVLVAILLGATLPIVPVQILWINMTTAVFLGLTMAFEPTEHGIMGRPPRPPERPLFTASLLRRVVLVSLLLVVAAFGAYRLQLGFGASLAEGRTTAINVFVGVQAAYLLSCRSLDRPVLRATLRPAQLTAAVGGLASARCGHGASRGGVPRLSRSGCPACRRSSPCARYAASWSSSPGRDPRQVEYPVRPVARSAPMSASPRACFDVLTCGGSGRRCQCGVSWIK
ncbi:MULTISPECIES: cation transporting ATPase C-terminal domain-containing protein [Amycolatopsis]|uniref:cation transporting ATPase C-terminal domain-containing protein n=1 Tax=Amycolatopsis TaxID=1813 RepID=UPI0027E55045|nr:cation transporting ATPase C-terminal domain-containing protein [Amycolatopsis bullii]